MSLQTNILSPGASEAARITASPRLLRRAFAAGFTLFELILVIALVATFSGVLLKRFVMYQELAERAAMEQTVATIRSALHLQMAGMISRGRVADIPKLAAINPFQLLSERQKNYAGEFFDARDVSPGNWYYDLRTKEVVYVIHNGAHFKAAENGEKAVRFKTEVAYNDALANGGREIGGIAFHETRPYRWDIRA